jgi:hypothetical protein
LLSVLAFAGMEFARLGWVLARFPRVERPSARFGGLCMLLSAALGASLARGPALSLRIEAALAGAAAYAWLRILGTDTALAVWGATIAYVPAAQWVESEFGVLETCLAAPVGLWLWGTLGPPAARRFPRAILVFQSALTLFALYATAGGWSRVLHPRGFGLATSAAPVGCVAIAYGVRAWRARARR